MNRIEVKQIDFSYADSNVFKNFSLELDQRPTAIIGQNGAGKTTLVKLMKGLLKPQSGRISVLDKDLESYKVKELAETVGLVFQNPNDQIFKSKVIEEVMFGPLTCRQPAEEAKKNALWALEMVGLLDVSMENPYDLSLSERKFVAVASVLAMRPKWIILDEPTIAQDLAGKRKLESLVKYLAGEGVGVTAILHDMDFCARTFERVIVMSHGEIRADGHALEVFDNESALQLAKVYRPELLELSKCLEMPLNAYSVEDLIRRLSKELE